jgi:hypothetical protein
MLMQNCFSTTSKFSAVITYNATKPLTKAFIHGLKAQEITTLIEEIRNNTDNLCLPTLLPILLLANRVNSAVAKIRDSHDAIVQIEHDTRVKTNWHPSKACCADHQIQPTPSSHLETINFDQVTNELTSVLTKMAYCEFICNVHLPMLQDLDEISDYCAASMSVGDTTSVKSALRSLRGKTEYLRSSLKGVQARAQYLSKRSEAVVQTVRILKYANCSPFAPR